MEKSSVHYHHSAIQHYLKGDLLKAKFDCELVAAHIPKHASTIGLLATIEKALGNFDQAEKLFKESLEIDSSQADILCNYAGLLILKEEFQSSVQLLNKAIIIAPKIADYYERLGYALWRMCKYEYALKSSLKAIELNPELIAAHQNLGVILQAQGQLDQALEATLKVIELKPDHANAHINLGGILKQQGKLDQALEATQKAINIKPKQAVSHMNLGVILQEKGQLDQAMSATLKAIELNPDNSCAYINLAEILKRHEQLENANLAIERAMQIGIVGDESATGVLSYYETTNQLESLAKAMEVIESQYVTISIAIQIFKARLLFRNKQYKNSLEAIAKISSRAVRIAGSGSTRYPAPDILAGNGFRRIAIEAKSISASRKYFSHEDLEQLLAFSQTFGCESWLAIKFSAAPWVFFNPEDLIETRTAFVATVELAERCGLSVEELLEVEGGTCFDKNESSVCSE